MIEMGKKYKTRGGFPVRILCNDLKNSTYQVIAAVYNKKSDCEVILNVSSTGYYLDNEESPLDLIEVTLYEDFKVDDLCVVWTDDKQLKEFRYFAKVNSGIPYFFDDGKTSFTGKHKIVYWPNCRKATEEEIKTKTIKD